MREMLVAVQQGDAALLGQAVLEVATPRRRFDDEQLERALARFMARHPGAATVQGRYALLSGRSGWPKAGVGCCLPSGGRNASLGASRPLRVLAPVGRGADHGCCTEG
jgi:hypothetical protein